MTGKLMRTRARLLEAALELFATQGFEATTAAQIAARAGVTQMTFFRHFPTKAAVLIGDPYDPVIGESIRREPPGADPITLAARGVRKAWQELPSPAADEVRARLRIVAQTPSLRADLAAGTAATEVVVAEALTDLGVDPHRAAVAAGAVLGALNAALLRWSLSDDGDLGAAIHSALDVLEHANA
ncbi:TetR/AcrR family transcriptional regulator [Kribbella sp. CA-253562]|uniref:TetR/AcrR family transcriptional regulator n=1 Tax=Kribbella sp. CA-253562 TaxID=3239942 RepID=UPI003D8E5751